MMTVTSARRVIAGILAVICLAGGWVRGERTVKTMAAMKGLEDKVRKVVATAMPATVSLFSRRNGSSGSGVIVSGDGMIMTAGHVVKGLKEITVVFPDGNQETATVLGANFTQDAALVKLKGAGPWPSVAIGDSDRLQVGDFVVSLGHAGGFDPVRTPPVRFGRIVSRNRLGYLVSDCTLIGGDSGGPLFDLNGRVIGIHSSIGESLASNNHRGASDFKRDWKRLEKGEMWGHLTMNPLDNPDRPVMGFSVDGAGRSGILVGDVAPGSPAEVTGMRKGDVLRAVEGTPMGSFTDLLQVLADRKPGELVTVVYLRQGRVMKGGLKLARLRDIYGDE